MKYTILLLCLFVISCKKTSSDEGLAIYIYKTKIDYSTNVSVTLTNDKSKIFSAPGPHDIDTTLNWPIKLNQGYLLNGINGGFNTAFLSLKKKDYYRYSIYPGADSLFKLIIENDPFIEFYYYSSNSDEFYSKDGFVYDTAKMNKCINDGQLGKYFSRLK